MDIFYAGQEINQVNASKPNAPTKSTFGLVMSVIEKIKNFCYNIENEADKWSIIKV